MASSIYDWSTTASSNGNIDSGVNFQEGQDPGTLNNGGRGVMGRNAEFVKDLGGALAAGGTGAAITVTANSAFSAYASGLILAFRASADNSAGATLNVNGIGAKSIRKMLSTGEAQTAAGDIKSGGIYIVQYHTALNAAAGGWMLLNPVIDTASFATLAGAAFTGAVSITNAGTSLFTVTSSDAGATAGPIVTLDRNSASPAASDIIGAISFLGRDSGAASQNYGQIDAQIVDATAASEDSRIRFTTTIAGTAAVRGYWGAGFYTASATSGDMGVDTINAAAYYINGALIDYTNLAKLNVQDQTVTGGANVTSLSLGTISSGTVTPDPGDRPMQHYTNNGAHTLAPGAVVGSYLLDIVNGASAGAITTSGWTMVVNGSAFTTTNTNKFRCSCSVGQQGSLLIVQALQ